jgi:hypothetical protein
MTVQRRIVYAGAVTAVVVLWAAPRTAHAQAADPGSGARALLAEPAGPSGFVNLNTGAAQASVTPSERALLGVSSGLYVRLEPSPERIRRSAGESALLGR